MAKCKDFGAPHEHAHGTTTGWSYHGCRCAECEVAHYESRRAYEKTRRYHPRRMAANRRYHRARVADGKRAYAVSDYHRETGWAAARRYRESNRDAINARARLKSASIRESVNAPRKKWWTPEDDQVVMRTDVSDVEIAYMLGRTCGAIAQRRLRLSRGAKPRYFRSDAECMRGHSRAEHGRHTGKSWQCRACHKLANMKYRQRNLELSQ